MTDKFWRTAAVQGMRHRAINDIPGCVPAVDVFIERTEDQIHRELAYDPAWSSYLSGDNQTYARSPRKFVRNPSVSYRSL